MWQVARSRKHTRDSQLSRAIHKSVKTAHKIFYACLANYRLRKLIQFVNLYLCLADQSASYSPFSLLECTFKSLRAGKPLPRIPVAILSVIKSLARFMALYFSGREPLYIYSVSNASAMPSLVESER